MGSDRSARGSSAVSIALVGALILVGVLALRGAMATASDSHAVELSGPVLGGGAAAPVSTQTDRAPQALMSALPLPAGLTATAPALTLAAEPDIRTAFKLNEKAHIQFMHVAGTATLDRKLAFGSDGEDVYVILETDRNVPVFGPRAQKPPIATYCWSFVTPAMETLDGVCLSYGDPADVPPIPG